MIKQKCDFNMLGKNSLCTCPTSDHQVAIALPPEFDRKVVLKNIGSNFTRLDQSSLELEEVLKTKALLECADQVAIDRLYQFICDMSDRALEAKKRSMEQSVTEPTPQRTKRSIELSLRLDQLGHLLGRNGVNVQEIASQTTTDIHVDNPLYSKSAHDQTPVFRLDSRHSFAPVMVTISGPSDHAVESAISALQEKVEQVKVRQLFATCTRLQHNGVSSSLSDKSRSILFD